VGAKVTAPERTEDGAPGAGTKDVAGATPAAGAKRTEQSAETAKATIPGGIHLAPAKDDTAVKVGSPVAPGPSEEGERPKQTRRRFVGATALTGGRDPGSEAAPATDEQATSTERSRAVRHRRVSGRHFVLVVALLLVVGAAAGWYYKRNNSSPTTPVTTTSARAQADLALAERLGVQRADLAGWTTAPGSGDAFASLAVGSPAATAAQAKASAALAQCLHVPTADVTDAFGGPSAARSAVAVTPTYGDPTAAGTTASSASEVMLGASTVAADGKVFANATQFASCYQPYAETMLPFAGPASAPPFTSVTVQTTTVPVAAARPIQVEAFQITRARAGATTVTTAVAIFGGRVQTTLAMTSTGTFPASIENSLVTALEGRVATPPT
jgi:hypothetical protein